MIYLEGRNAFNYLSQNNRYVPKCNVSSSYYWGCGEWGSRGGGIPNYNLQYNTQVLARKTATGTFDD
jgi:hypothetical protein